MDVTHALLRTEMSMGENTTGKKKRQNVRKEDAKAKYVNSLVEGRQ